MAKFEELDEEIQALFSEVIGITDLERFVNIDIIGNDRLKEIYKVQKANDVTKYLSKNDTDVVVIVNQLIFNQLPKDLQEMVAMEAITYIGYDSEKDKVLIAKPDVNTFSSILKKYGYNNYEVMTESIKSLYDKKQNDENLEGEE